MSFADELSIAPKGIYLHIPFCRKKCIYCDFYSVGERFAHWDRYVDALENELTLRLSPTHVETLYIGGGTPSLIPDDEFRRIASTLKSVAPDYTEFTIEVNPDDVTEQKARLWRDCGVNRVSMGVQSLSDIELRFIGRRHDAKAAISAYNILRKTFGNISLDLMFGLPGQTLESLNATIAKFIEMKPEHISAYSLMYEERTAITRMRDRGEIDEEEIDSVAMFELVSEKLSRAGYDHYEISNWSLPGYRSKHNSSYWSGKSYLGLGPAAHSYDGNHIRIANVPDLQSYLTLFNTPHSQSGFYSQSGFAIHLQDFYTIESLTIDELREEMIMTRLRTREGLNLKEFDHRFGHHQLEQLLIKARPFIPKYLQLNQVVPPVSTYAESASINASPAPTYAESGRRFVEGEKSLSLTESGIMLSDSIISSLI